MELINNATILVVPRWVRATVIAILGILATFYLGTTLMGAYDPDHEGWIQSGAEILGILIPLLMLGLIAGFSHSGVEALVARGASYLSDTIPRLTVLFHDPSDNLADSTQPTHGKHMPQPAVLVQSARNLAIANYLVEASSLSEDTSSILTFRREIPFRIELNATKANVNVLIPMDIIEAETQAPSPQSLFPHSVAGAEHEGYWFAKELVPRKFLGKDYVAIVAVKRLPADFLINPLHRLDFGQDLIFMLRSMLNERPSLFAKAGDRV